MDNPSYRQWLKDLYRSHSVTILAVSAVMLVAVGYLVAGGFSGMFGERSDGDETKVTEVAIGPDMWTCSMHPQIRLPNPGDCPICQMDLIPVPKSSGGMRTLVLSPETRALMKIASQQVERRFVSHEVSLVGRVDYDETKFGYITAWVPGRLDRLFVDYTGVRVKKGDHMVSIYSPELHSAQAELIEALKYQTDRKSTSRIPSIDLAEASREKLRLLGVTESQIKEIERNKRPTDHLTVYSPVGGIVTEKMKQEGDYVKTGERIYAVADLKQVWVHLDAYESDLQWIRYGQEIKITTEAYPGEKFDGKIAFIQPVLNNKTRTVKVRVNVPNLNGKLKPDMFVRAIVSPLVAAGGRVMDPGLAGKWISPMHPEIVKDKPGICDICGMPLVRSETLGYVTPNRDPKNKPVIIPYSAALVTGKRAIVYVELPVMPDGVQAAFQGIETAVQDGAIEQIRRTFKVFSNILERPNNQPATKFAKDLWHRYADLLGKPSLDGQRAQSTEQAKKAFDKLEQVMIEVREQFGPQGQPTFEGREIVLGSRAGRYYLVRNGLQEGEMIVTQGNFKIDAEIQIQAKPSMMTPEGGGGGGHNHGGPKKKAGDKHAGHKMTLPVKFSNQIHKLEKSYQQLTHAIDEKNLNEIKGQFSHFGKTLQAVNGSPLIGHARMQWKEYAMLLGNDVVEGVDLVEGEGAEQLDEADRVFLLLKGHMRRMREQLGIMPDIQRQVERFDDAPEFQAELAVVWDLYQVIQQELASDDFQRARQVLDRLESAVVGVDDASLKGLSKEVWKKEKTNLLKIIVDLKEAKDIKAMRAVFKPLSEEIGLLARSFGFGDALPIFELHCPMAIRNKGAIWYQSNNKTRNPYLGSRMPTCADRVERLNRAKPDEPAGHKPGHDHSKH